MLGVLLGIRDPETKFHKIKQMHKDPAAQKEAMLRLWYTTHPLASWSLLHQALKMLGYRDEAKSLQERFLGGAVVTIVLKGSNAKLPFPCPLENTSTVG